MRIAHVTATFPPYQSGTGNVCYHNARELARRGHEVHVFTARCNGAPGLEVREQIQVHRLRPILRLGNAPVLLQLLRQLKGFDIIHLHYPFFGGEITTWAAKLSRSPLVITYHQDVFLAGWIKFVEKLLRLSLGRWTLRSAARVLFTSEDYSRATYIRPLIRGREERIGVLPNGVDLELFSPVASQHQVRAQNGFSPDDRIALMVASLDRAHAFKGVDVFLNVIAMLNGCVKGVIVGDGDLREYYEQLTKTLGVESRLAFARRVSNQDLPDYYRLADVTVLPSVSMGEAFGLVLVESLACGTPVVASDLPGVRTVVANGEDGLLGKPGSAADLAAKLSNLLAKPVEQRKAMGAAGRRKVAERYSWKIIGDQLETIYGQAAASAMQPTS